MRAALLATLLALVVAAPARAQDLGSVASALQSDPVYVDASAELAGQVDAGALRSRISSGDAAPMFIAVLPASAKSGSAGRTLIALRNAVGEKGTYALAVGDEFRTLSDFYDASGAGDAARSAHPDDLEATLEAFIDGTAKQRSDTGGGGGAAIAGVLVIVLLALVLGTGVLVIANRRRARAHDGHADAREPDQKDDFVRLGDGIRALELDVELTGTGEADYDRAVAAYERANELNGKGDRAGANRALDEGLEAIAAARERIAGRKR